jgi:ATP-dependent Lhr-like helicase
MIRTKELPDRPKCPRCGSSAIGFLKVEEEKALTIIEKEGGKLTKSEGKLRDQALQTAQLIEKYGKPAAVALSARRIPTSDIREILRKEPGLSDRFYELVLEAERKVMSKRFW